MKNIIFCADGTWNGPGEDPENNTLSGTTNVFKLLCNLGGIPTPDSTRLKDEQESILTESGAVAQVAKYIHGVGDSDNFLVKLMGGTLGACIISRIVRGYTFISRNYQPGDRIFIIGFSRGAYTARALAGLISAKGLLDATKLDLTDKSQAYRLGSAVWYGYRKSAIKEDSLFGALQEIVVDLPGFLTAEPTSQLIPAQIAAVAVWDTVGALGIPEYAVGSDDRIASMRFVDNDLSQNVALGYHAISIDEERDDFTPTLWNQRKGIEQRLFPGAHADVGGGYPDGLTKNGYESGLSDGALVWMSNCLAGNGVQFANPLVLIPAPHADGTAHQPWISPPWNVLPHSRRIFPDWLKADIDDSVNQRKIAGNVKPDPSMAPDPYDPQNI